jgi:hypothetical protein
MNVPSTDRLRWGIILTFPLLPHNTHRRWPNAWDPLADRTGGIGFARERAYRSGVLSAGWGDWILLVPLACPRGGDPDGQAQGKQENRLIQKERRPSPGEPVAGICSQPACRTAPLALPAPPLTAALAA